MRHGGEIKGREMLGGVADLFDGFIKGVDKSG